MQQEKYVESSQSFNPILMNLYIVKDSANYMSENRLQTFVVSKADATNFLSAWPRQTYVK